MKILTNYFFLILVLIFVSEIHASLETDYFRSKSSGSWHDPAIWESSPDNSNWENATFYPNNLANTILVNDNHSVSVSQTITVDQLVINAAGVLIINGVQPLDTVRFHVNDGPGDIDMTVYGRVIVTETAPAATPFSLNAVGVISFEAGSVYEHNQNGGGIPISRWQQGSTLLLNAVTDTPPANRAQDYSNIIVDLPDLAIHLNMGFRDNIISGDLTVLNTGLSRFVLVGPVTDSTRTVTFLGNINVTGGSLSSHGTENPNSHAVLHVFGDINVTGGNFSVIRGAQGGSGTTIWYLHGNLSISDAETENDNPAGAKFIFKGPGEHNLVLSNVTYGEGGLPVEVDSSSLNIGNNVLRGNGMFTLGPGAELIISHGGGIDSVLQNTGALNLSPEASYIFNGTSSQVTGQKFADVVNYLTINNQAGLTISKNLQVNNQVNLESGSLLLNGFILTLGSEAMLNETNGIVTGSFGKITTTREINAPSVLNVAGLGAVLTSGANLGSTTVERFHYPALVNGNNSIARQYTIVPANNAGLNATLRIHYLDSELDTLTEGSLKMFSSVDGSDNNWENRGGTINTEENYAEITGLDGFSFWTLAFADPLVSVKDDMNEIPGNYSLYQNYPNPFNPETVIRFDLPEDSFVNLSVYNLIGEKVLTIIDEDMNKGKHTKILNAVNLPSGVYLYKLTAGNKAFTKKMILMK